MSARKATCPDCRELKGECACPADRMAGRKLTTADPEPPSGTVVRDSCGADWERRDGDDGWWQTECYGDPESWVKIAGNYGPVTVVEWGETEWPS